MPTPAASAWRTCARPALTLLPSSAFFWCSKGKAAEELRGAPYLLSLEEVALRTTQAWDRGATEVCMQVLVQAPRSTLLHCLDTGEQGRMERGCAACSWWLQRCALPPELPPMPSAGRDPS